MIKQLGIIKTYFSILKLLSLIVDKEFKFESYCKLLRLKRKVNGRSKYLRTFPDINVTSELRDTYTHVDVTQIVRSWHRREKPNYGFCIWFEDTLPRSFDRNRRVM